MTEFSLSVLDTATINKLAEESYKEVYGVDRKFANRTYRSEVLLGRSSIYISEPLYKSLALHNITNKQIELSFSKYTQYRLELKDLFVERPYAEFWFDALLLEVSDLPVGILDRLLYPSDSLVSVEFILRSIITFSLRYFFTDYVGTYHFDPEIIFDSLEDVKDFLGKIHPSLPTIDQDYYTYFYTLTEPEIFNAIRESAELFEWFARDFFGTSSKTWKQLFVRLLFTPTSTIHFYAIRFSQWLGLHGNVPFKTCVNRFRTLLSKLPKFSGKTFFQDDDELSTLDSYVADEFYNKILRTQPNQPIDTEFQNFHLFDYDVSVMSTSRLVLKLPKGEQEMSEKLLSSNVTDAVRYYFTTIMKRPFKQVATYLETAFLDVPNKLW